VQAARARFSRLAVYDTPDAPAPIRVLVNPWRLLGSRGTDVPQVLLVEGRRPDGWIHVLLPDTPVGRAGWVRAFDVALTRVPYRIRVERGAHRVTVLDHGRAIYRGPITIVAASRRLAPGQYYLRSAFVASQARTTANPYAYGLLPQLVARLPLGTPVDLT
jgi:hypothetical protein